jgi:hypothetical protein
MLHVERKAIYPELPTHTRPAFSYEAFVIDEHMHVLLTGTSTADLMPAEDEAAHLPAGFDDAIGRALAAHDFERQSIAQTTTAEAVPLRISKIAGRDGPYYAVLALRRGVPPRY